MRKDIIHFQNFTWNGFTGPKTTSAIVGNFLYKIIIYFMEYP